VPSPTTLCIKKVLAKNSTAVLEHTAYSPDLAPFDFLVFPTLKNNSHWTDFERVDDIQKLKTVVRKNLQKNDFRNCFDG
jgi:hypothetical protein